MLLTIFQPARRWRAGLVVLVLVLSAVGALRLSTSSLTASLSGGDVGAATKSQERQFGGEPITISIAGPLGSTLAPKGISALIDLEGRLAKLDGVAAVVGPGGFINQSTIQADRLVTVQLGPTARRAGRAGDRARRSARRRGASAAEAARLGDRARIAALGADRSQFEQALVRLGGIGLPSIANPAYVNAIVFGSGNAPKARFRWLFPDADHAVILVRPDPDLSPGAVVDLDGRIRALAARTPLRGATATVGGSVVAAAAAATDVPVEIGRVALLTVLLFGGLLLVALRGRARRVAARVGGISILATVAGVLASSAVGQGLSLATVVAVPVLLALAVIVALRVASSEDGRVAESGRREALGGSAAVAVGVGVATATAVVLATWIVGVPVLGHVVETLVVGGVVGSAVVVLAGPLLHGRVAADHADDDEVLLGGIAAGRTSRLTGALRGLPSGVRTGAVVVVGLALVVGLGLTVTSGVRSDPTRFGPAGLRETRTAREVARQVGVAGELRIALRGDVTSPASVRWLDRLGAQARRINPRIVVGPNVGELLAGDGRGEPTASRIAGLLAVTPEYLLKPMISTDRRIAELRLGIPPVGATAARVLVRRLVSAVGDPPEGLRAEPAGLLAAADHSDRRLETARYWLPGACLLLLLGGLVVRRRSLRGPLVLIVPPVAGAGAVGLLTAGLSIEGSPVVAAVLPVGLALGLALALLGEDGLSGVEAADARRASIASVGLPAALIAAAGLGLLACRVVVVREFGGLLAAEVLVSVVAVVVVLPALRSRLGAREHVRRPLAGLADGPERSSTATGVPVAAVESDVLG